MGEDHFLLLVSRQNAAEAAWAVFSGVLQDTCGHFGKNTAENSKKGEGSERISQREDCRKGVSFNLGR